MTGFFHDTHARALMNTHINFDSIMLLEILNANTRIAYKGGQGQGPDAKNSGQATLKQDSKDAQQG
ncbi:hypothetical protein NVIE_0376 [Nitrososphaera viennensis EN76]|uniref:Uncharacterized protein n=1 Tax=Nitrososphaera viennensis EN76 TaxID=926571 RepID=A0A060HG40_9ARCH|nr:hypothetical protein NVIE_0376 [Nitrososphaera viennensis EN76]